MSGSWLPLTSRDGLKCTITPIVSTPSRDASTSTSSSSSSSEEGSGRDPRFRLSVIRSSSQSSNLISPARLLLSSLTRSSLADLPTSRGSLPDPAKTLSGDPRGSGCQRTPENTCSATLVNKGKHKAGAARSPGPLTHLALKTLSVCVCVCLAYPALYATTSPAVTWGGFGAKAPRSAATNSPALKVDCSSASL